MIDGKTIPSLQPNLRDKATQMFSVMLCIPGYACKTFFRTRSDFISPKFSGFTYPHGHRKFNLIMWFSLVTSMCLFLRFSIWPAVLSYHCIEHAVHVYGEKQKQALFAPLHVVVRQNMQLQGGKGENQFPKLSRTGYVFCRLNEIPHRWASVHVVCN